jgi:alpha-L-fucosidase 2
MAEMLLQSHHKEGDRHILEILPALPGAWPNGEARGLRARGGFEVDLAWKDGRLSRASIRSGQGALATLRYGTATRAVDLKPGQTLIWDGRTGPSL